jgi:Raf kinase inhibitor-like YbhB/YbcL family protein
MNIQLTSPAFPDGQAIPAKYTCDGDNVSPPLKWTAPPPETRSVVIICEDPEAKGRTFAHWLLYGLSPSINELPEEVPNSETIFNSGKHGLNDFGKIGYGGPCPPPGPRHRYYFIIYALDCDLQLKPKATLIDLLGAIGGHVVGEGKLLGYYRRG